MWTADVHRAKIADRAGVDRIGVDLERLGKLERQRGHRTWLSPHTLADLQAVAVVVEDAQLFARLNSMHADSGAEVEEVLARGADVLMLPMVMTASDAESFVRLVDNRASVVLLVEHCDALRRLPDIVAVPGVTEVHLGLNDLAISLGPGVTRWMVLAGHWVEQAAAIVLESGKRFGLGGIGRVDDTSLPIPSELVYAEYARSGARAALLARSFFRDNDLQLAADIAATRAALNAWLERPQSDLHAAHIALGLRAGLVEVT